ncbi:MAG: branched-chain amino acid aminotransferase [Bdellovibrionaceae bacterium]|nr:branched-chain amino acid aminotransferase [Pseudobdellovibrionaceae bacterium]
MTTPAVTITRTTSPKTRPPVDQLGFGRHFTDHMFLAKYSQKKGWYSAEVVPYGPLSIDPCATVLHYGQALFEGLKAFRQQDGTIAVMRPHFNWQRLQQGAERLCMEAPPEELFLNGLYALLNTDKDWIPTEPGTSMYVRPTLIATEAFLGVRPAQEYLFFIVLSPVSSYYSDKSPSVRIWVEKDFSRAAPGGLGATKAGANYASSLKAALSAKEKGYAQVLWLDVTKKYIEEVGTMNVFFVIDEKVITPRLTGTILEGGTRGIAIELLRRSGRTVEERDVSLQEIKDAANSKRLKEAFGTGTAAVIAPIGELTSDDFKILFEADSTTGMGPISAELLKTITSLQKGITPDKDGWMKPVPAN